MHILFFDDMVNIKNIETKEIKIGEKSPKNVLIYLIGCMMLKDLS